MTVLRHVKGSVKTSDVPTPLQVRRAIQAVYKRERKKQKKEINVIFVDNRLIRQLNKQFFNKNRPTDVIAFPYEDGSGDIYVSVPVAKSNARLYQQPPKRELTRLVVHGMLHLFGYKDKRPTERKIMWTKQEKLVDQLCGKVKSS